MSKDENDAISAWLLENGKLWRGGKPKTKKDAARRFRCERLTGGCMLLGEACARRHQFARAREAPKQSPGDSHIYWAHRDDSICASCPEGAARAQLLGIGPTSWKDAFKAHKNRRHLASVQKAKEEAEREEDDLQSRIDWPIDARPRGKNWEQR